MITKANILSFIMALSIAVLPLCAEDVKWSNPTILLTNYNKLKLQEVLFADSATTLYFMTDRLPVDESTIYGQCCLVDYRGNRHRLLSAEGLTIGSKIKDVPPFGPRKVSLSFEPIDDTSHPFDMLESPSYVGNYFIGISNSLISKTEQDAKQEVGCLEEEWREDTVTIIGYIDESTRSWARHSDVYATYYPIDGYSSDIVYQQSDVRENGTFTIRYKANRPMLTSLVYEARRIPYFAYPGDTVYVEISDLDGTMHQVQVRNSCKKHEHTALLQAVIPLYPDYYNLVAENYKIQTRSEFWQTIDSLKARWELVNSYLAEKYALTGSETHLLIERMNIYFDVLKIVFVSQQEMFCMGFKKGEQEFKELSDEDLDEYAYLQDFDISDKARFCTDVSSVELLFRYAYQLKCFHDCRMTQIGNREQAFRSRLQKLFATDNIEPAINILRQFVPFN